MGRASTGTTSMPDCSTAAGDAKRMTSSAVVVAAAVAGDPPGCPAVAGPRSGAASGDACSASSCPPNPNDQWVACPNQPTVASPATVASDVAQLIRPASSPADARCVFRDAIWTFSSGCRTAARGQRRMEHGSGGADRFGEAARPCSRIHGQLHGSFIIPPFSHLSSRIFTGVRRHPAPRRGRCPAGLRRT